MGRHSESWRRGAVARWRRSGLSAAEFAPGLGVSVHTLYAWSSRVRCAGRAGSAGSARDRAAPPGLVELIPTGGSVGPDPAAGVWGSWVEIVLRNGRVVRAPSGVDGEHLRRLIAAAESD